MINPHPQVYAKIAANGPAGGEREGETEDNSEGGAFHFPTATRSVQARPK